MVTSYSLSAGQAEIGDLFSVPCCEMEIGVGGIPGFSCTPILYVCMYVCTPCFAYFVPFTLNLRGRFLVGLEGELC